MAAKHRKPRTSPSVAKVAAVVVGGLAAASAAAPAFAAPAVDTAALTPTSLNGGYYTAATQLQGAVDTVANDALDPSKPDSLGKTVDAVAREAKPLLPQEKIDPAALVRDDSTTAAATGLLGGLPTSDLPDATGLLGGLPLGG
ncbi:hypothetical protein [Streptomyces sp. SPB074]|uniref:hypothetical protein n=1 Tax=Streptomyces sp. (strain SPB074) TaxID=465543 RepID=UPI0001D1DEE2|nr:hypothetical protein [Streptomyces sp. SPB074]EFG64897.1 conserved hypothetical protein [Streptomyces sp. SPB074]